MNELATFLKLKNDYKLILTEAALLLGFSRLILLTTEFRKIAPCIGHHMIEATDDMGTAQLSEAKKVAWAVNVMSRHTFWESKCLVQAITAKTMLKRRKIKSTIYLGVAKDENGKMIAHAWVKSCGIVLTGANEMKRFTVVSMFGDL